MTSHPCPRPRRAGRFASGELKAGRDRRDYHGSPDDRVRATLLAREFDIPVGSTPASARPQRLRLPDRVELGNPKLLERCGAIPNYVGADARRLAYLQETKALCTLSQLQADVSVSLGSRGRATIPSGIDDRWPGDGGCSVRQMCGRDVGRRCTGDSAGFLTPGEAGDRHATLRGS